MHPSTIRLAAMHTAISDSDSEEENENDLGEQTISVNTVDVQLDISSRYRATMENGPNVLQDYALQKTAMSIRPILRKEKMVSFYLPDMAPYIFFPIKD